MKLQKIYGYGVFKNDSFMLFTYQENTILQQASFLENWTIIQNSNLILRYLLKLLISLSTQKLIFHYQNIYKISELCFPGLLNLRLKQ